MEYNRVQCKGQYFPLGLYGLPKRYVMCNATSSKNLEPYRRALLPPTAWPRTYLPLGTAPEAARPATPVGSSRRVTQTQQKERLFLEQPSFFILSRLLGYRPI